SSLRSVLQAMGIAAASEEEIAHALRQVEQAPWLEILPPVLVAPARAEPVKVPLRIPARPGSVFEWVLELEGGARLTGTFAADPARESGRYTIGPTEYREYCLEVPRAELGYHRLTLLQAGKRIARMQLIATPERCYEPEALREGGRVWGPALQLYAV